MNLKTPESNDTQILTERGFAARCKAYAAKLRDLPLGTSLGIAATGGALAVVLCSVGVRLATNAVVEATNGKQTAIQMQAPQAQPRANAMRTNAKAYIVPEGQEASLPAVQPSLADIEYSNQPNANTTEFDAVTDAQLSRQRRLDDRARIEKQRLEDRKRIIERELENKAIEEKRRQEDEVIEDARRAEREQLTQIRRDENKKIEEEARIEEQRKIDEERQRDEQQKQEQKIAAVG